MTTGVTYDDAEDAQYYGRIKMTDPAAQQCVEDALKLLVKACEITGHNERSMRLRDVTVAVFEIAFARPECMRVMHNDPVDGPGYTYERIPHPLLVARFDDGSNDIPF